MAISYVGGASLTANATAQTLSLTSLTGGSDTQPAAGDIVVVGWQCGSNGDRLLSIDTTGYTTEISSRLNDTFDVNWAFGWKVMGATPDTQVDVSAGSVASNAGSVLIAQVYRGVDTTNPLDVAAVNTSGINSAIPDPGSITPVTSGAWIIYLAANAHDLGGAETLTAPYLSNAITLSANNSFDCTAVIGHYPWTSGAYDAAAMTFSGADSTGYSWAASAFALRPAAGGGGGQTITGADHSDSDSFGAGTVAATYTITGAGYSDSDGFGSGAGSADYAITGAAHADADAFGTGAFTTSATIAGSVQSDADIFGAGVVTTSYGIAGSDHLDGDTFGAGAFSQGFVIDGTAYSDVDGFGAGAITTSAVITGATHADADAFGFGTVSQGGIVGAAYSDPDSFGSGGIVTTYTIVGSNYADSDTFGDGEASAIYAIAGAINSDDDSFGSGAFLATFGIAGSIHVDLDAFGSGALAEPATITNIILASAGEPGFRVIGGSGSWRAPGGSGSINIIGGGP